jgi:hypothetical protein
MIFETLAKRLKDYTTTIVVSPDSDGKITVAVVFSPKDNKVIQALAPITFCGEATEIDKIFLETLENPTAQVKNLMINVDAFESSKADADKKLEEKKHPKKTSTVGKKDDIKKPVSTQGTLQPIEDNEEPEEYPEEDDKPKSEPVKEVPEKKVKPKKKTESSVVAGEDTGSGKPLSRAEIMAQEEKQEQKIEPVKTEEKKEEVKPAVVQKSFGEEW